MMLHIQLRVAQMVKNCAHDNETFKAGAHMTMSFSSHSCSFAAILSALDSPLTSPVASDASLQLQTTSCARSLCLHCHLRAGLTALTQQVLMQQQQGRWKG